MKHSDISKLLSIMVPRYLGSAVKKEDSTHPFTYSAGNSAHSITQAEETIEG